MEKATIQSRPKRPRKPANFSSREFSEEGQLLQDNPANATTKAPRTRNIFLASAVIGQ